MPPKRAFLAELPGDPLSDYLAATLSQAPSLDGADALVLPRLTNAAAPILTAALTAAKPVFLPAEALPETLPPALTEGLSTLTRHGLTICPLTHLPAWVQRGVNCAKLLTLDRLNVLAARGFDRIYLSACPAATPLARRVAKERKIQLTGGIRPGTG